MYTCTCTVHTITACIYMCLPLLLSALDPVPFLQPSQTVVSTVHVTGQPLKNTHYDTTVSNRATRTNTHLSQLSGMFVSELCQLFSESLILYTKHTNTHTHTCTTHTHTYTQVGPTVHRSTWNRSQKHYNNIYMYIHVPTTLSTFEVHSAVSLAISCPLAAFLFA